MSDSRGADCAWLVAPDGWVVEVFLEPRDGVQVDALVPDKKGRWFRYPLIPFFGKRADKRPFDLPLVDLAGSGEARTREELIQLRAYFEAVGEDLLRGERGWVSEYPWPVTEVPDYAVPDLAQAGGQGHQGP